MSDATEPTSKSNHKERIAIAVLLTLAAVLAFFDLVYLFIGTPLYVKTFLADEGCSQWAPKTLLSVIVLHHARVFGEICVVFGDDTLPAPEDDKKARSELWLCGGQILLLFALLVVKALTHGASMWPVTAILFFSAAMVVVYLKIFWTRLMHDDRDWRANRMFVMGDITLCSFVAFLLVAQLSCATEGRKEELLLLICGASASVTAGIWYSQAGSAVRNAWTRYFLQIPS